MKANPSALAAVLEIFGSMTPAVPPRGATSDLEDEVNAIASLPLTKIPLSALGRFYEGLIAGVVSTEVTRYLLPLALVDWDASLHCDTPCWHPDGEFHLAMRRSSAFERAVSTRERRLVIDYLWSQMLRRLGEKRACTSDRWILRLNSIGCLVGELGTFIENWLRFELEGYAVAWVEYTSGFVYGTAPNPLFGAWTSEHGGGGPYLWAHDSEIHDAGWLQCNILAFRELLHADFVLEKLRHASGRLSLHRLAPIAARVLRDCEENMDSVERRCRELVEMLRRTDLERAGWTG